MGFNFSFFGKQEVRRFSYKPRFYDPETEERRKKYGDFTKPKETTYVPGQHVKGSFRDGNYQKTSVTDANDNKTEYSYNGNMKNDIITLPDGHTVRYEFDGEDRTVKVIDQQSNATILSFVGQPVP